MWRKLPNWGLNSPSRGLNMHRLKILRISPELFVELCKPGDTKIKVKHDALPPDTVFIRTFIDDSSGWGQIGLVVRSAEFEELPEGAPIPEIKPIFEKL